MFRLVVFEKCFSFVFQFTILSFSNLLVLFLTKLCLVFLYLFFILASSDECLINLLRLCVCSKMNLIFCFQFIYQHLTGTMLKVNLFIFLHFFPHLTSTLLPYTLFSNFAILNSHR